MTRFESELIGVYFVGLGSAAIAWGITKWRAVRRSDRARRAEAEAPVVAYRTPPDIRQCRNLRLFGPTPCAFPNCECFDQVRR